MSIGNHRSGDRRGRAPGVRRLLLGLLLALTALPGAFAQTAPALQGIGPFLIKMKEGEFKVRLLRREKDILWVMQEATDGTYFQSGLAVADLQKIEMPTPALFAAADKAASTAEIKTAHEGLDKFILLVKPFRDLPGVLADDAVLKKAQLFMRSAQWAEAVRLFADLQAQPYDSPVKTSARLLSAIAYQLSGDPKKSLELFEGVVMPEEDEDLLSAALFARGSAQTAVGQWDAAVQSFLELVLFHPYVQNNEARCLEAVLPCYAEMKDWESLYKTILWLRKEYPQSGETKRAEVIFTKYKEDLRKAGQFVDGAAESSAAAPAAAAEAAPAASSNAPAPDVENIEVD